MNSPLRALHDVRMAWLLRRSQQGDRSAFQTLYRALYEPVWGFVRRRVGSEAEAEDVVSQVFLQFVAALPRIDSKRGTARSYAVGMARNLLIDRARSARSANSELTRELEAEMGSSEDPHHALEREETHFQLRQRIATLPPEDQELLRLRFEDDLRHVEISHLVGKKEAAVRQRLSRLVRELRREWVAVPEMKKEVTE